MSIILTKYGNTVAITTTTNKVFYMSVKQFLNGFSLNARGPEGPDVIVNGLFTANASGWTLGAGWTWGSGKVSHTAGIATLEQAGALVAGQRYFLRFAITGTIGSVTVTVGTQDFIVPAQVANKVFDIINDSVQSFRVKFTPSTDFNGSIDTVTLKPKPYLVSLDTDRLDEANIPLSAWTIAGNSGLSTVAEVGQAIADLVKYDL